ncbi:MAG: MarR family transcriptional regulator [Actinomycetota bacterium]
MATSTDRSAGIGDDDSRHGDHHSDRGTDRSAHRDGGHGRADQLGGGSGDPGAAEFTSPIDFSDPIDEQHAIRIGRAWTEMRRGASMVGIKQYIYGTDDAIRQGQMDALDLLARRDRTMRGLAERLRVDPSTATRAAQSLVADGLAERHPSPEDGRVVLVRISDEGRRVHAAAAARRAHIMALLLGEFSPEERSDLAWMLQRFVDAMDRISDRIVDR